MTRKEKAHSAITAVFPNAISISEFVQDDESRKNLQSFIAYAARHDLIAAPTVEAFQAFIQANSRPVADENLDDLTIAELINNKRQYLNIKISNSALIDKINNLVNNNDIRLPKLSAAMFTRIKTQVPDTPRKRDALRSFAFWIGYERRGMGEHWHYETLKTLCLSNESRLPASSSGVRMAFAVFSRGNNIGYDVVTWMKKAIKTTFSERKDLFDGGKSPIIKSYDLTTFHVDLPNPDQSMIPSAYTNTLKDAIAIAHQIAIQWIMSGFATHNAFFSIGIAAGEFNEVNIQLQAILNVKLPQDPVIRLTDYARQCVVINHIKIIMNHAPREIELVSGETFKAWWITELSGMIYWNLVPGIINESYPENVPFTSVDIMRQLMLPGEENSVKDNEAIICFLKFPHRPILGFEIVRALVCRNKLAEAMEILNALLRVTPHHLNARITRMTLYKFIGMEASDYYLSDMMFKMAEKEVAYIIENLDEVGEDFYYEYALLKLARLSTAFKALRQHQKDDIQIMDLRLTASDLVSFVNQAEDITMQGMIACSPTFERIIYLYLSVQVLKCILLENTQADGGIKSNLACAGDKIKQHMAGVFMTLYSQSLSIGTAELKTALEVVNEVIRRDDSMIALEIFKPAQYFIRAVFFWDIFPVRNVAIIRETIKTLIKARDSAEELSWDHEHIYSIAGLSGQFMLADQFISQIDDLIGEIEKRYCKASVLEKMNPVEVIGSPDDDLVLMTHHV